MKKRHLVSMIAMLLALMMLGAACSALADEELVVGQLAYLNLTDQDSVLLSNRRSPAIHVLFLHGVLEDKAGVRYAPEYRSYDSLNDLLMALQANTVKAITLPYYTARFLCATNDGVMTAAEYHPEKLNDNAQRALEVISDGYSFLLKEENTALRDELDAQITAMKEDGTLQQLIDEHIIKVSESGEPVAVDFETFEGDPIRVGVTGDLPPMDYVSADGTFAGFNTAVLAEIGRRLQKNIELVQVSSVSRSLALAEGRVDVVFWTRGMSEAAVEFRKSVEGLSKEELEAKIQEELTDEEKAILDAGPMPDDEELQRYDNRDTPPETIITQAYFSDFPVLIIMK